MGTNFYRRYIPTEDDIKNMHKLLDERKFESDWTVKDSDYKDSLENYIHHFTEEIHICKRSGGWQISFDHNWGKYYFPCREELESFLLEPHTIIVDEYGDQYTPQQFWKEMDEWNAGSNNNWTSKTYREYERQRGGYEGWLCTDEIKKCKAMFGVEPEDNDFTVDGLRFMVFTDFC